MKLTPWYLAAIAPLAVAGCSGAFLGHVAVLVVTLCIFIGTLNLGRAPSTSKAPHQLPPSSELNKSA
jgi:hypothetical protein